MSNPFVSRVGGVLSADIAVPDHERVTQFYSRVLSTGDSPLWREDLMNNHGIPVVGVGARTPEYAELPLQWMPHIQVDDIATSVARALDLGATELIHGKDDNGNSQWAVLLDPYGAAFGLVPIFPSEMLPPQLDDSQQDTGEPVGCIAWLDLTVSNASAACNFYQNVVGWSVEEVEMTDGMSEDEESYADYNMLGGDGNPAAGICHARGTNLGVPPVWMLYLPVGDLAESVRRVSEEGGTIIKAQTVSDSEYSYVTVQDPAGAYITLARG